MVMIRAADLEATSLQRQGQLGLWASALAGAGYVSRVNYDRVEQYISPISKIVLAAVVVAAVAWFLKRRREQQTGA